MEMERSEVPTTGIQLKQQASVSSEGESEGEVQGASVPKSEPGVEMVDEVLDGETPKDEQRKGYKKGEKMDQEFDDMTTTSGEKGLMDVTKDQMMDEMVEESPFSFPIRHNSYWLEGNEQSGILVFKPTLAEMANFSEYVAFMESVGAHNYGIAKVIAPDDYVPRKTGYDDIDEMTIVNPIKQVISGTQGKYQALNINCKDTTVGHFKAMAANYSMSAKAQKADTACEREYWSNVTFQHPTYGADVSGSMTDKDWNIWNISHLGTILDELAEEGVQMPGVNTSYLYFGMWKATFAWHKEDKDLYSINYIHTGAPKQWYAISPKDAIKFQMLADSYFPFQARECSEYLRHKMSILSPSTITRGHINVHKTVHHAREFIITFPAAFHAGFNHGFNIAESTNFASDRWIDIGKKARSCECHTDTVRIDMMHVFLRKYRPQEWAVMEAKRLAAEEQERERARKWDTEKYEKELLQETKQKQKLKSKLDKKENHQSLKKRKEAREKAASERRKREREQQQRRRQARVLQLKAALEQHRQQRLQYLLDVERDYNMTAATPPTPVEPQDTLSPSDGPQNQLKRVCAVCYKVGMQINAVVDRADAEDTTGPQEELQHREEEREMERKEIEREGEEDDEGDKDDEGDDLEGQQQCGDATQLIEGSKHLTEDVDPATAILQCQDCAVCVHPSCYGIDTVEAATLQDWKCERCFDQGRTEICAMCPNIGGAFKRFKHPFGGKTEGLVRLKEILKTSHVPTTRFVHLSCALWTPEVVNATSTPDISSVPLDRWKLKCRLCESDERCLRALKALEVSHADADADADVTEEHSGGEDRSVWKKEQASQPDKSESQVDTANYSFYTSTAATPTQQLRQPAILAVPEPAVGTVLAMEARRLRVSVPRALHTLDLLGRISRFGSKIQCVKGVCVSSYHATCARRHGLPMSIHSIPDKQFITYCMQHAPKHPPTPPPALAIGTRVVAKWPQDQHRYLATVCSVIKTQVARVERLGEVWDVKPWLVVECGAHVDLGTTHSSSGVGSTTSASGASPMDTTVGDTFPAASGATTSTCTSRASTEEVSDERRQSKAKQKQKRRQKQKQTTNGKRKPHVDQSFKRVTPGSFVDVLDTYKQLVLYSHCTFEDYFDVYDYKVVFDDGYSAKLTWQELSLDLTSADPLPSLPEEVHATEQVDSTTNATQEGRRTRQRARRQTASPKRSKQL
eukprot:m.8928 g.8928  ORF g.8928 m.8928 type:complete len:1205 (+) comp5410_c0_seq1:82-3696(+)